MKKNILLFLSGLLLLSCGDFGEKLLNQQPETVISEANFWQDENDFQAASREMHARFRFYFGDIIRRFDRDRGMLFDYLIGSMANISQNLLEKACNVQDLSFSWEFEYNIISQANQILNGIEISGLSRERKDFFRGEALFMRAYVYFYITKVWGAAPLIKQDFIQGEMGLTPWQEIQEFILRDLREAVTLLPRRGKESNQIPTRGSAYALLAHVCAWKGSLNDEPKLLEEGIRAATEVIECGDYELAADPAEVVDKVLKGDSREGIFEIAFYDLKGETNVRGSCMAYICQTYPVLGNATPQSKRRMARISNKRVKEVFNTCGTWFDEIFYHFDEMAALPEATNQGAAYIWKFRHTLQYEDGPNIGRTRIFDMNEILIRLADIILLRGEMYARLGETGKAVKDLDRIRERCGAAPYSAGEGDVREMIFHQREQELFLEGLSGRYFDVVRNGLDYVRKFLPGRFKEVKSLEETQLPVYYKAFYNNPLMEQNRYWNKYPQFIVY